MAKNGDKGTEKKKRSGWIKGLDLLLRTWHIGVTGVLFGGAVFEVSFSQLFLWHHLVIASGSALIVSKMYQSRHWLYQVRGIMALLHVGLLAIVHFHPESPVPVLTMVLVLGVFAGNLPGYIKQWSILHHCRIEEK